MSAQKKGKASPQLGYKRSETFKAHMRAIAKRGADHPSWKGGKADLERRAIAGYKAWRDEVRRRAGGLCEGCLCNRGKGRMHAHHLKDFASHPELRLNPDNGAWLCDTCHVSIHALAEAS
jgi:hypothetical protein